MDTQDGLKRSRGAKGEEIAPSPAAKRAKRGGSEEGEAAAAGQFSWKTTIRKTLKEAGGSMRLRLLRKAVLLAAREAGAT